MKTMISRFFLISTNLLCLMLLASCGGGGSSDAVKDPNTVIENGKIGDFEYKRSSTDFGNATFDNEFCPSQELIIFGTGTLNKVNGNYQISLQRNKTFIATCPGDKTPFTQQDSAPTSCEVGDEILACSSKSNAYTYQIKINLKSGQGWVSYEHHHLGQKGFHSGISFATIYPLNWLGKTIAY